LLLYNHGPLLPLRINIGEERRPVGPGDFGPKSFHLFHGINKTYPVTIRKGRSTFFTLDASKKDLMKVLQNPVLQKTYFDNLHPLLTGIASVMPTM
jgi:hypothetical protein